MMKIILVLSLIIFSSTVFSSGDFIQNIVIGSQTNKTCIDKKLCFRTVINGKSGEIQSVSYGVNNDGTCPKLDKCIVLENKIIKKVLSKSEIASIEKYQ